MTSTPGGFDSEYTKNAHYDVFGTRMADFSDARKKKQELIEDGTRFVMARHIFLTVEETKEILYYDKDKGVYVSGGELIIEKDLEDIFEFKLRVVDISEIKGHIMRKTYVKMEEFDADLDILNMKNGLYNWRTNKLKPHTPEYYSMIQCGVKYDSRAKPKYFMTFLKEVLYAENIRTALEIIAYTFIRLHLFECYFILVGTGSNGKSVFVGVLCALHGKDNTANVSLKELVEDRFALADLVGKNVNVDTELSSSSIKDMSILKKLTGNQPIRVQKKGQHAFESVLWAKQIFNANQLPVTDDHTDAHFRREITLSFPYQFKEKKDDDDTIIGTVEEDEPNVKTADIHMLKKLTTKKELSGIFNLVAKSMRAIDRNKKIYADSKSIDDRREKAELTRDPIGAFVDICKVQPIAPTSNSFMLKEDLYKIFKNFCEVKKLHVPSYGEFAEIMRKEHGYKNKRKMILGKKETVWYVEVNNPTGEEEVESEDVANNNINN